jgi:hypothetical protein
MYRRSIFLEALIAIRQEMAREADYDADLFAEMVRSGRKTPGSRRHDIASAADDGLRIRYPSKKRSSKKN